MRVKSAILLTFLLLQGSGNGEKISGKIKEGNVDNSTVKLPFHDHCDEIYKEKNFEAHIFSAILKDLQPRMEASCADEGGNFNLIRAALAGNLWCKRSLSRTSDILLEVILGEEIYGCPHIEGFHGVYVQVD